MRQSVFERERETLRQAQGKASGTPSKEDYLKLLDDYQHLLSQSEKIVSIGDSTQNKLVRAQKMLHRAIQRYKEAADKKSEILSMISHDIKNKAAPIRELSRWVIEDLKSGDKAEHAMELLKHISEAADQLIKSVNDTLNRESPQSTSIVPVFEWSDLSHIAEATVENQRPSAIKKNIEIKSHIEQDCEALVDEFLLGEVFENLLNNAIKFSSEGSVIETSLIRADEEIRFKVVDHGPGLNDEDMERIFGKYQILSAKPTGGEVSTGLGLFIAHKLITLHKGKIEAFSEGKDMGSTFTVFIPIPKDQPGENQFKVASNKR